MVRPKKHLGQHFLTDRNISEKIANCVSENFHQICEIGPGTGILTQSLLKKNFKKITLIEIDAESVEYLKNNFTDPRLSIIETDFLKLELKSLFNEPLALIGNFPYNISSQIFFKIIEHKETFTEVAGMIQKEVAERIIARPGNKTYGILSVLLQTWFDLEYCFTVNETVFFPPPKVKSAVIRLKRNNTVNLPCDEHFFIKVVKTAFNQRRKTLRNALKPLGKHIPDSPLFAKRAEQLSVNDFVNLTSLLEEA
jgi:16S rRNA (adenine1518-N6/adenine1519-N6)-dimethyltransferase